MTHPRFSPSDQARILHRARLAICQALGRPPLPIDPAERPPDDDQGAGDVLAQPVSGCFVSIKRRKTGQLRGCRGVLGAPLPLADAIDQSAIGSTLHDERMPPVAADELPFLKLEVWILDAPELIDGAPDQRADQLQIGRHGLRISQGEASGLLLPGVAQELGVDAQGFLRHVCLKAGLAPTAWREPETRLERFVGTCVAADLVADQARFQAGGSAQRSDASTWSAEQLDQLATFCRDNIWALARGAVPNYYLPAAADGETYGLLLAVVDADSKEPVASQRVQAFRFSWRQRIPIQASLFRLSESLAAQLIAVGRVPQRPDGLRVALALLDAPAVHGTVEQPDLDGFDPARRALLVVQGSRYACLYDQQTRPCEFLAVVTEDARITAYEAAGIYSLRVASTDSSFRVAQRPSAEPGAATRPPAVAGIFYPADPQELARVIDRLTATRSSGTHRPCVAAMVPHAGLHYSGHIAAKVLQAIDLPPTVLIIGPKHTRRGVDWAVAPHRRWSLPGLEVESDMELALQLAARIDGLELDANAHAREHAIEVELPLLARRSPTSRVVGVAIGLADLPACQRLSQGLARVLENRLERTLLLISSDMNHFASDRQTRLLDRVALRAMATLDAEHFYRTVVGEHISMCGLRPACIVLETLRLLGVEAEFEELAYGTSGDITGETSRVVGYAGVVIGR